MNTQNRLITAVAIFIVLLGLSRVVLDQDPFKDLLHTITKPVSNVLVSLTPEQEIETSDPDATLSQQYLELEAENRKLRDELELDERYGKVVTAEIERRDMASYRKTIWVNRGSSAGIKKDDAVLADRFLIGIVVDTSKHTSEIQLITDPEFRATAKAGGANGLLATRRGSLIFDLVPKKTVEGKLLVTDGIDGTFAPGLAIATVGERIDEESGVFSVYRIELPQNPIDINFVSIVSS